MASKNAQCAQLLLDAGVDVNARDQVVLSAQSAHIRMRCAHFVLCFVQLTHTALFYAASYGARDCLKVLLDAGADPNLQSHVSSLHHAFGSDNGSDLWGCV